MSKKPSPLKDYAVYLLARSFVCLLETLPPSSARGLALLLADLTYWLDRRHRQTALDNLRHAFGDRFSEEQRLGLVRGAYRHFFTALTEFAQMPRHIHVENWLRTMCLENADKTIDCLTSGRPVLIVTGHFGNWEMAGYLLGLLGFTTHAVARELDNPHLDGLLRRWRERTGQKVLAKKGDFDEMQKVLEGGGVLATLADQDAGQRGQFVDFFGRPASTHKAVALMALEYNVPLLVVGTPKSGDPTRYAIRALDVIRPEEYEGRPDAIRAITQRFTLALEGVIREFPGQYFWFHRRWKHQPPQRKAKKVA